MKKRIPWNKGKKGVMVAWNKGLTKETDDRVKKYGKTQSITKKKKFIEGRLSSWNKGLTKENNLKIAIQAKNYPKNRKNPNLSDEVRKQKRINFKGENNPRWNFNKTDYQLYMILCKFQFDMGKYLDEFDLNKIRNMYHPFKNKYKETYVRDHMYSKKEGFKNNILPLWIRHPSNCRLITFHENSKKLEKSCLSKDELFNRIKDWDNKYGFS